MRINADEWNSCDADDKDKPYTPPEDYRQKQEATVRSNLQFSGKQDARRKCTDTNHINKMRSCYDNTLFVDSLPFSISRVTGRIRGHTHSHNGEDIFFMHAYGVVAMGEPALPWPWSWWGNKVGVKSDLFFVPAPLSRRGACVKSFDMAEFRATVSVCTHVFRACTAAATGMLDEMHVLYELSEQYTIYDIVVIRSETIV